MPGICKGHQATCTLRAELGKPFSVQYFMFVLHAPRYVALRASCPCQGDSMPHDPMPHDPMPHDPMQHDLMVEGATGDVWRSWDDAVGLSQHWAAHAVPWASPVVEAVHQCILQEGWTVWAAV